MKFSPEFKVAEAAKMVMIVLTIAHVCHAR